MDIMIGLAVFLTCAFMFLAGWLTCRKFRYPAERRMRILRAWVLKKWSELTKKPDPHTPYNRKRVLKRLNDL